jgi:tetratricopeptide (TPR) repeat protein
MIELDHSFEDAYYKKAAALDELGQLDEALAAYKETITKNYMLPESNFYSGVILQKQHHYDEALKMYDEALKYKDNAPPNGY